MENSKKCSQKPKLSIVTVVRNDGPGLAQTIASLQNQSFRDFEYIVIDGASTDGTLDVVRRHEANIQFWQSGQDDGIYDAMNQGLCRAEGQYILFLNAGDRILDKDALQRVADNLASHPAVDLFYFQAVGERQQPVTRFRHPQALEFDSVGNHQATWVRTSLHRRFPFRPRFRIKADRDVQVRLLRAGGVALRIPEVISVFQGGGVSSTQIFRKEFENLLICWQHSVRPGAFAKAFFLAVLRVVFHRLIRLFNLNWDTTKSRFDVLTQAYSRRFPIVPSSTQGEHNAICPDSRMVRNAGRFGTRRRATAEVLPQIGPLLAGGLPAGGRSQCLAE